MNKKIIYFFLGMIFLLGILSAVKITTLDNDLTAENITFSGNENYTRNITIYKNANVTSAFINLSGFLFDDGNFSTGQDKGIVFSTFTSTGSVNIPAWTESEVQNRLENNDTTADRTGSCTVGVGNENYQFTQIFNLTAPEIETFGFRLSNWVSRGQSFHTNWTFWFYNFTSSNWDLVSNDYTTTSSSCRIVKNTMDVDKDNHLNNGVLMVKYQENNTDVESACGITSTANSTTCDGITLPYGDNSRSQLLRFELNYTINNQTLNPYLEINDTIIWNYTGEFRNVNNKTLDFASTLNTALNGGVCDCDGCTIDGINCKIPITFHSDTVGKIQYSDININWLEYVNPNISIISPTGTIEGTSITINAVIKDDSELQYCYYNVTAGASLEISNTQINCSNPYDTNVVSSSTSTYQINFFANDTSGNVNVTNGTFSTTTGGGGSVQVGGGGSTTTIIEGNLAWTMEVAPGIALYEISMPTGSSRTLGINFENLVSSSVNIELSCEDLSGNACKYVEFENKNFELPLIKDTKTRADFTIILPDEAEKGDYKFNIRAKDQNGRDGVISVDLSVEVGVLANLGKLTLSTDGGIPYALFSIGILIISILIFSFGIPKEVGKNLKPIIVIGTSIFLAILPLYLI